MSPCCGSVCLLVLLGVVLAAGIPCQFVPENLKRTHESIADVLKLKDQEVGSHPLFGSVIKNINTSCQRKLHLINATLDVYSRIFSSILQHQGGTGTRTGTRTPLLNQLSDPERSQVEAAVTAFQQKMDKLKKHLSHLNHDKEDVMDKLNRIEVDDPLVQRRALAQFNEIFQAASVIGSPQCGSAHSHSAE